jgi:hypothetical protein
MINFKLKQSNQLTLAKLTVIYHLRLLSSIYFFVTFSKKSLYPPTKLPFTKINGIVFHLYFCFNSTTSVM